MGQPIDSLTVTVSRPVWEWNQESVLPFSCLATWDPSCCPKQGQEEGVGQPIDSHSSHTSCYTWVHCLDFIFCSVSVASTVTT